MELFCEFRTVEEPKSDTIIIYAWEGSASVNKHLKDLDGWTDGSISTVFELGEFTGKKDQIIRLYPGNGIPAKRVFLIGIGKKASLSQETAREYGGAIGKLFRDIAVTECTVFLPDTGK